MWGYKNGVAETHSVFVLSDGTPQVGLSFMGVRLFAADREYRLLEERADVRTTRCKGQPQRPGLGVRAVSVSTGQRQILVRAASPNESSFMSQSVVPLGSFGSTLLLQACTYRERCNDVHGSDRCRLVSWDIARGRSENLLSRRPTGARWNALRSQARNQLDEAGATGPGQLTAVFPHVEEAKITAKWVFVASACRSCGDRHWGSYTTTANIVGAWPSGLPVPRHELPLLSFMAELHGLEIRGWSSRPWSR